MKQNNEELQIDIDFAFVVVEKSLLPKREYTQNLINKFLRLNLQVFIRLQSYTLILIQTMVVGFSLSHPLFNFLLLL